MLINSIKCTYFSTNEIISGLAEMKKGMLPAWPVNIPFKYIQLRFDPPAVGRLRSTVFSNHLILRPFDFAQAPLKATFRIEQGTLYALFSTAPR